MDRRREEQNLSVTIPATKDSFGDPPLAPDFKTNIPPRNAYRALDVKRPAEIYTPSARPYRGLPKLAHPFHDKTM
jgi:hypothetical protein